MPLIWTVPEQPLAQKMSLAELAAVSNSECLKAMCVGVVVGFSDCLFLPFISFHIDVHMTLSWTVPEQHPRTKRCA